MSIINSFLQKRKMHENQHGFFMVIAAYVLSFIMLVVGSDVFYNINSTAAIKEKTEEAEKTVTNQHKNRTYFVPEALKLQTDLINPYGIAEIAETGLTDRQAGGVPTGEASIWLMGSEVSASEYDALLEQVGTITSMSISPSHEAERLEEAGSSTTAEHTMEASPAPDKADSESKKKTADSKTSKSDAKEADSSYIMTVSDEEITMLQRIVEAEASGEDMVGKILIANVVFNRLKDEDFPKTIKGVIFEKANGKYQFSPVSSKRYWSVKISKNTKEAVKRALEGEDYSDGALYFMARKKSKQSSVKWFDRKLDWLFKHGGHEFYKNK